MTEKAEVLRRTQVRHFLSDQKMVVGVEYQVFKIWLAVVLILAIGSVQMGSLVFGGIALPIMFGVLIYLHNLSQEDAFTRKKYMRYMRQADVYEPWSQVRPEGISGNIHPRPLGFGRNRLV